MDNQVPCSLAETKKDFFENIKKLAGGFFNLLFILDTKGAIARKTFFESLIVIAWGFLTLLMLYKTDISTKLGTFFQQLFQTFAGNAIPDIELIKEIGLIFLQAIFNPYIILFISIISIPFIAAYRGAVEYLSDIYELKDHNVAAKFIWQAAFASEYDSISIIEGEVAEKDKESFIYQIGGPGIVNVDFCSAVLFEKPNGRPHVIGPTYKPTSKKNFWQKIIDKIKKKLPKKKKPPTGNHVLGGFERYRFAKNLRDEALLPIEIINVRTREGIPVTTKDVRLVYSIWRGEPSEEEKKAIYPYRKEAIPSFFYDASCTVSDTLKGGCYLSPDDPMQGIVSNALSSFISEHSLGEFLTSIGEPETENLKELARTYQKEKDQQEGVTYQEPDLTDKKFNTPAFTARREANPLFTQFTEEFSANNRKKGVVLYWLGVGTWTIPSEVLEQKNEEAQKISKENRKNGSSDALEKVEKEAKHEELLRLIKLIPLQSAKIMYAPNNVREDFIRQTLETYTELIRNASLIVENREGQNPNQKRTRARASSNIYNTFPAHWLREHTSQIGKVQTTSPNPETVEWISNELRNAVKTNNEIIKRLLGIFLRKTKNDRNRVIDLIAREKEVTPRLNLVALVKNAIDRLDEKL